MSTSIALDMKILDGLLDGDIPVSVISFPDDDVPAAPPAPKPKKVIRLKKDVAPRDLEKSAETATHRNPETPTPQMWAEAQKELAELRKIKAHVIAQKEAKAKRAKARRVKKAAAAAEKGSDDE